MFIFKLSQQYFLNCSFSLAKVSRVYFSSEFIDLAPVVLHLDLNDSYLSILSEQKTQKGKISLSLASVIGV